MTPDRIDLLKEEIAFMMKAAGHLDISLGRCAGLFDSEAVSVDELERLEALASRFARLSDILTQRIMRLIDDLELLSGGTLLDRFFLAEKRGWVHHADSLIRIRKLRNMIAHDYAAENVVALFVEIGQLTPELLEIVPRVEAYALALSERLQRQMGVCPDAKGN